MTGIQQMFVGGAGAAKGTFNNPGESAQDILNSGQTASGWYYIKTSTMATPRQVYCNMTDNGGGWMLVGYNPSNVSGSPGLLFFNSWSAGQGTLNKLTCDINDLWFNAGSPQCTRTMRMANTSANQTPFLANMTIANYCVYASSAFQFPGTNVNIATSYTLNASNGINLTWYNLQGYTQMSGPIASNCPIDWIYNVGTGYYWTVCGPSNDQISTGRSGNGQGTGSWTNSTNNNIYGMKDVPFDVSGSTSNLESFAIYIK